VDRPQLTPDGAAVFVATVPRGLADLTGEELRVLGAQSVREHPANLNFSGDLLLGYRACLWSRTASRILLQIASFPAATAEAFHAAAAAIDWRAHVPEDATIACEFTGEHAAITHSHFGALKLKDAICDQLRGVRGHRPDVAAVRPSVRLLAHAHREYITLYVDMAGEGLHRRGYRMQAGEAPLRENVAAGVLMRARWPQRAAQGEALLDPMCGSGTLVIEAALMALDLAPGLQRDYWGFSGWGGHQPALWQQVVAEAQARRRADAGCSLMGSDADAGVLRAAALNAQRAGVEAVVRFEQRRVSEVQPADGATAGLVVCNPPYGERLDDAASARAAHQELGNALRERFTGWQAAVLTGLPDGAQALGLRTVRTHELWNGALPCRLLRIDLAKAGRQAPQGNEMRAADPALAASAGAQMFANRLRKNQQQLRKLAAREGVSCYRLYDADMPEYAFAIDRYQISNGLTDGEVHLQVQEYAAPRTIDPAAAARRRAEALAALPGASELPVERIHLRVRQRQSGTSQYQSLDAQARYLQVEESGLRFHVNLTDYLDTGLFLDHRLTRARLRREAASARFLNLFCYTATGSVYAAAGGAAHSVSVDLSNTYLDWAASNFALNGLDRGRHELVRADCRTWLAEARQRELRFELIFLDPPTFSNSRRMEGVLDVQRDHPALIADCLKLLAPGGLLLFSTNAQQFKIDPEVTREAAVTDISAATIPFDFQRNTRIHYCFEIRRR
jgi:23S rRNA (guanine2445-N2)-methyltransferase / 23S rRNA (guanine2069-N7)-methyltransferase